MTPRLFGCSCVVVALGLSTPVWAQAGTGGTIIDGNAIFTQGDSPTSNSSSGPLADFLVGGPGNPDHLVKTWWWRRLESVHEFPLAFATSSGWKGNSGQMDFNDFPFGSITQTYHVTGLGDGAGVLTESQTLVNTTNFVQTWDLFHYLDADLGGTSMGDSAVAATENMLRIVDGDWTLEYAGTSVYQVSEFSTILDSLTDNATTMLDNSGVPFGSGNFTGAFQWSVTLQPGESVTISTSMTITYVPAPSALALLGLGGLFGRRRRRA